MWVHMSSSTRRFVLAAVAIGIPVLWAFVPYAYRVGEMQYMTFGSITFGRPIFLGLWVPLYPALQAARLLVAPSRLAARRRWVWFVEGPALLLLSLVGWWQADWALGVGIGARRRRRFSIRPSGCCQAVRRWPGCWR
jgi:hypothetical protein